MCGREYMRLDVHVHVRVNACECACMTCAWQAPRQDPELRALALKAPTAAVAIHVAEGAAWICGPPAGRAPLERRVRALAHPSGEKSMDRAQRRRVRWASHRNRAKPGDAGGSRRGRRRAGDSAGVGGSGCGLGPDSKSNT